MFGVKETLIADFRQVDDPAQASRLGFSGPFWTVDWDFVLARRDDELPIGKIKV